MEETREKLEELLKLVHEKNIYLSDLKVIKKYPHYFQLNIKWKLLMVVIISWILHAKFNNLFNTKNV